MAQAAIPLLLGGGAAAAGGTAATVATLASIAGPVFAGFGEMQQARALRKQEELNARVADLRAMQTETAARQGLEAELGSIAAAFQANGARPNVANLEIINDIRRIRDRETRIAVGNERQRADDFRRQGAAYRSSGRIAAASGLIKGAPSLFDLLEM